MNQMTFRYGAGLISLIAMALGLACIRPPGQVPPLTVAENLDAEFVVSGADFPSALAFADDGRVFYTEKNSGRIRVIADGVLLPEPFAELAVNSAGDRGLLGIARHPDFENNQRIYVFYTLSDSGASTADPQAVVDNRVVYFEAAGNVAAGSEIFVVSLPAGAGVINVGGRIAFAADGTLFVALGDLGDGGSAQDTSTRNGKILRYTDDGRVPADNPIADSPVYAVGVRDVRALAFDPQSGRPFITERNPAGQHEINRIEAQGNLGWPQVTGKADTADQLAFKDANPAYSDPILDTGGAAPHLAGGSFNPSARYGPDTSGEYFYAEAAKLRVLRMRLTADRAGLDSTRVFATGFPTPITDVAFTPAGTLYVACENAVFRIVPVR